MSNICCPVRLKNSNKEQKTKASGNSIFRIIVMELLYTEWLNEKDLVRLILSLTNEYEVDLFQQVTNKLPPSKLIENYIALLDESMSVNYLEWVCKYTPKRTKLNLISKVWNTVSKTRNLENLRYLQSFRISGSYITDEGLTYLLKYFANLKFLDVRHSLEITNESLTSISFLSELEELNLSGCNRISDNGILKLKSLTKLKSLDLTGLNNITNHSLE